MAIHKGNELNNVRETWKQNEAQRRKEEGPLPITPASDPRMVDEDLQQTISEEAAEYDRANKEDRLLGGDRASLNDEENKDD